MADEQGRTFEDVHERLSQIVDEVSAEDISLDDALKLYEEAVKLGLSACDLSEQDLEAHLAAAEGTEGAEGAEAPADSAEAPADPEAPAAGDAAAGPDGASADSAPAISEEPA